MTGSFFSILTSLNLQCTCMQPDLSVSIWFNQGQSVSVDNHQYSNWPIMVAKKGGRTSKLSVKADQLSKKLEKNETKKAEQLRKEQLANLQAADDRKDGMIQELSQWFLAHPQALQHIHRGAFMGSFDALDGQSLPTVFWQPICLV